MLRSARNPIKCAFGRLKARWGILTKKVDLKLEHVPIVVFSCFILHNYYEQEKSDIEKQLVKVKIEVMKKNEETFRNVPDPVFSFNSGEGQIVGECLTSYTSMCLRQERDKSV